MAIAQAPLLTADDYRLMPETGPRYQLIGGELLQQDPGNPAATHSADATFTSACFPGLSISAREVFKR